MEDGGIQVRLAWALAAGTERLWGAVGGVGSAPQLKAVTDIVLEVVLPYAFLAVTEYE